MSRVEWRRFLELFQQISHHVKDAMHWSWTILLLRMYFSIMCTVKNQLLNLSWISEISLYNCCENFVYFLVYIAMANFCLTVCHDRDVACAETALATAVINGLFKILILLVLGKVSKKVTVMGLQPHCVRAKQFDTRNLAINKPCLVGRSNFYIRSCISSPVGLISRST